MEPQFSPSVDDELVTAYVDGDVSAEERRRVEAAMAADERVAWEVTTLRQTVELLRDMPRAALPRSFVLTEDQVEDTLRARRARPDASAAVEAATRPASLWERLLSSLNGGNLALRNAAAVAIALLLLVVAAEFPLQQNQSSAPSAESGPRARASSAPQPAMTVVGGSLSQAAGGQDVAPAPEDQDASAGDSVSIMGVASTAGAREQGPAARETAPAVADRQPVQGPAISGPRSDPPQVTDDRPPAPGGAPLRPLRYVLGLLAAALIALWQRSRFQTRENCA